MIELFRGVPTCDFQKFSYTYDFLSAVVEEAVRRSVICATRNPRNSIYRTTSFFRRIQKFFRFVVCEACAFGSRRPRKIAFAVTCEGFDCLAQFCPGVECSKNHLARGACLRRAAMTRLDQPWSVPPCAHCLVRQTPAKSQLLRYTPLSANDGKDFLHLR